jgi:hypothetical protein
MKRSVISYYTSQRVCGSCFAIWPRTHALSVFPPQPNLWCVGGYVWAALAVALVEGNHGGIRRLLRAVRRALPCGRRQTRACAGGRAGRLDRAVVDGDGGGGGGWMGPTVTMSVPRASLGMSFWSLSLRPTVSGRPRHNHTSQPHNRQPTRGKERRAPCGAGCPGLGLWVEPSLEPVVVQANSGMPTTPSTRTTP